MADTTFVAQVTKILASWLNEVNDHIWHDTPVSGTTVHDASVVGFTQAGTGATARTAREKAREIERSPEDYGAAAAYSAATDDRTFVQAAVDACDAAGGGTVILNRLYALNSFSSGYYTVRPKSGVSVRGKGFNTGFKFANSLRSATQGLSVLYDHENAIAEVVYENFKVDWNGPNNLQPNPETVSSNVNRLGGAAGCKNVHIRNVWFKDSAAAHHVFLSDSAAAGPNGNCSVIGCIFQNAGKAIAGNSFITDHTSIYLDVQDSVCTGNIFLMDNLNDTVATALETHRSNASLTGNVVYGYATAVNVGAQVGNSTGIKIIGNSFQSCLRGVVLWSGSAFILKGVTVSHNLISCRENAGVVSFGVLAIDTTMASSANGTQLTITGNTIVLETQAQLTLQANGILLWRWDDVTVADNAISHWVGEGLMFQAEIGARKLHRISVSDNRFRGCGLSSTAGFKRVIVFNASTTPGTDDIDHVSVSNNQIICDAPAGTAAAYGIQFNNGRFPNAQIIDNEIVGATTALLNKDADTGAGDIFFVRGKGAVAPFGNIRATYGSLWLDTSTGRVSNGVLGSSDGTTAVWLDVFYSTAAPVAGTWHVGDRVYNVVPAVGQPKSWACTVGGTPGTWVSEGNL